MMWPKAEGYPTKLHGGARLVVTRPQQPSLFRDHTSVDLVGTCRDAPHCHDARHRGVPALTLCARALWTSSAGDTSRDAHTAAPHVEARCGAPKATMSQAEAEEQLGEPAARE
ncbi:hypothetical protein HPB50_002877 [Hyalomma asiaticum]|uniref:Uncharacterized protein n=1 Tax=Hyalomma asiaticum TaxID=266040 RepID=A0ACB7SBY0_HYAAI|nr:hypothetical protein HPB50_002877 [Hyalomma asiaticum]